MRICADFYVVTMSLQCALHKCCTGGMETEVDVTQANVLLHVMSLSMRWRRLGVDFDAHQAVRFHPFILAIVETRRTV